MKQRWVKIRFGPIAERLYKKEGPFTADRFMQECLETPGIKRLTGEPSSCANVLRYCDFEPCGQVRVSRYGSSTMNNLYRPKKKGGSKWRA